MNLPRGNSSLGLLKELEREKFLPKLVEQLNKDAQLSGLDLKILPNANPGEIVKQLSEFIAKLMQSDFQGYLNFLYRVDIPEHKMRMGDQQSAEELVQNSTLKILSREWEKVWFKNKIR